MHTFVATAVLLLRPVIFLSMSTLLIGYYGCKLQPLEVCVSAACISLQYLNKLPEAHFALLETALPSSELR